MAKKTINIGGGANDGTGDTLRVAGGKINDNFNEVYTDINTLKSQGVTGFTGSAGPIGYTGSQASLGSISASIIPDTDVAYDIGSFSYRFNDLYLNGNTIYLGTSTIQSDGNGGITIPGSISTGESMIGFDYAGNFGINSPINTSISNSRKRITFETPYHTGWTLTPEIVVGTFNWTSGNFNVSNDEAQFQFNYYDSTTDIESIDLIDGGSGYAPIAFSDIGIWFLNPNRQELYTPIGVFEGGYSGIRITPALVSLGGFVYDAVEGTIMGTETATGNFNGHDYSITYGLKVDAHGGAIVDPDATTVTIDGGAAVKVDELMVQLFVDINNPRVLLEGYVDQIFTLDFAIKFDKPNKFELYTFAFLGSTKTTLNTSEVIGDLRVYGSVDVGDYLHLNVDGPPIPGSDGMLAICDGIQWDAAGDGERHLLIYLNDKWNIVNLTPIL